MISTTPMTMPSPASHERQVWARQTSVLVETPNDQAAPDLQNRDSRVVSGDELGTPPLPSGVFFASFFVEGLTIC